MKCEFLLGSKNSHCGIRLSEKKEHEGWRGQALRASLQMRQVEGDSIRGEVCGALSSPLLSTITFISEKGGKACAAKGGAILACLRQAPQGLGEGNDWRCVCNPNRLLRFLRFGVYGRGAGGERPRQHVSVDSICFPFRPLTNRRSFLLK